MKKPNKTEKHFYHVRYWPQWILFWLLISLTFLPYKIQLGIGKLIGYCIYHFGKKLKHIATININLCFPNLSQTEQDKLIKDNCIASGIALIETALSWFGNKEKLRPLLHITGAENITNAQQNGKGVIILGPHLLTLEIAGRLFTLDRDVSVVYRAHKKPFINYIIEKALHKHYPNAIERNNVKGIVRALKKGEAVWITPDIDGGYFNNVFIPFFGVLASCITAPSRLAKLTGATTLLSTYYRREDGTGYDIHISEPLKDFPTDDVENDILFINQLLEKAILKKPEQYLWQYKRFKTRPEGEKRFY